MRRAKPIVAACQDVRYKGLAACQPRPFRVTTEADAEAAAGMPDLVQRNFTADRPGVKFVGDITYLHTWQGFVYLTTVIDCYSKEVAGWSIADHMRTELVADALKNAAATTRSSPSRSGTPMGAASTSRPNSGPW
jgi:putative transposase